MVASLRALSLQATHPRAFAVFAAHTGRRDALFQRLSHTGKLLELVIFGSRAEADRVARHARVMHARVTGEVPRAVRLGEGADRGYRADEPELLLWVLACWAESAVVMYEALVGPLAREERERFWQDSLRVGEMFGLPPSAAPGSYDELRRHVAAQLQHAHLLEEAYVLGRRVALELPVHPFAVPLVHRVAVAATRLLHVGHLPPDIRRRYGLRWTPWHALRCAALTNAIRLLRRAVPTRAWRGSISFAYDNVARAEAMSTGAVRVDRLMWTR